MRRVLDVDVALERARVAEHVDDHGVVDDQLRGRQRVHLLGVAAEVADGLTHGGQVDDAGHAGEVLHDHPGRGELDLDARVGLGIPVRDGLDVVLGDVGAVLGAQQILGQHLEAVGQVLGSGYRVQSVDLIALVADLQVSRAENELTLLTSTPDLVVAATGCVGGGPDPNSTLVL